jgi:hypothetical protein
MPSASSPRARSASRSTRTRIQKTQPSSRRMRTRQTRIENIQTDLPDNMAQIVARAYASLPSRKRIREDFSDVRTWTRGALQHLGIAAGIWDRAATTARRTATMDCRKSDDISVCTHLTRSGGRRGTRHFECTVEIHKRVGGWFELVLMARCVEELNRMLRRVQDRLANTLATFLCTPRVNPVWSTQRISNSLVAQGERLFSSVHRYEDVVLHTRVATTREDRVASVAKLGLFGTTVIDANIAWLYDALSHVAVSAARV